MDSPQQPTSPQADALKSSSSYTRIVDDVTCLTSYNPFSEEDEHDQSSYTLVSSLFSRVKNSLAAPLSSAVSVATANNHTQGSHAGMTEQRRASGNIHLIPTTSPVIRPANDRLRPKVGSSGPSLAPPLVSVVPAISEIPTFNSEQEKPPGGGRLFYSPSIESYEGSLMGNAVPGFPIQDDARSVHTATSLKRSASVSKVIRRIRGEGLSKDYWMDDENAKECYDCKSVFTTWRRKHHCRICGQIFCSRCASNVIKGSRFGHEGMLRICNLCLDKLNYDDDDDDDRRSITSNTSFSYPQHAMDHYLNALGHHSQSPFAASQLFGRIEEPYNLYSIAETRRQLTGSDGSGLGSRPLTPGAEADIAIWEESGEMHPAPFRRALTEDDRDAMSDPGTFPPESSPTGPKSGIKTPNDLAPLNMNSSKSTIQFPGSSPEHALDSPYYAGIMRSRVNSYAENEGQAPFLRSRVHSRLNELNMGETGWRTRRESTAYAQELNTISMFHLRIMLRQMLANKGVSNLKEWEETLLKLSLRIARDLTSSAYHNREGPDMDVRSYVKIKRIPGGRPSDSEYVDGAVITKNVAHKQMSRSQRNPRIMLITFPLEFQRVEGQYMNFGQILRQEKEYLNNLVSRIAALRPHVVLVEKSVSRLALEALVKQNITVARSVKEPAIKLVSRMTQGDIFSSIDKLAVEPRLGHCGQFRVQTFDHPLIPTRRKTFMRFEGCSRDLGCTVLLRGGNMDHLERVKKVTLFLAFMVRHLKLETHLWKDSLITAPHLTTDAVPTAYLATLSLPEPGPDVSEECEAIGDSDIHDTGKNWNDELPIEDAKMASLSKRIRESLDPYLKTFISISATLRFPPPYPIKRMKELDDELQRARRAWEDEIIRSEENTTPHHVQEATITPSTTRLDFNQDIAAQIQALPSPGIIETPLTSGLSPESADSVPGVDYFSQKLNPAASITNFKSREETSNTIVTHPETQEQPCLRDESEIARHSAADIVQWQHDEQRRVWEWYLRKNRDSFIVEEYQHIHLLEFTLPITELGHHRACFPPQQSYMEFYGKSDCTLGQFIEKAVNDNITQFLDPKAICSGKACDQPLARHCRVFVHNESRLLVYVDHWEGQMKARLNSTPDLITTWSSCRVCGSVTPLIPVSEETQRYSLAKFLELHFYPADVQLVQGAGCIHNIYERHIRYFAMRGRTVTFQTDPITLYEIVFPPSRIRIKKETLFHLKNRDYEALLKRNTQWYSELVEDLQSINIDAATGDEETDTALTTQINLLINRAILERAEMAQLIQDVYKSTSPIDTLALNRVRAERQDRIVAWEADFDKLPKPKLSQVTERDGRKSSAFGSVRAMWPKRYELAAGLLENLHLPPSNVSEAEESVSPKNQIAEELISSAVSISDVSDVEGLPRTTDRVNIASSSLDEKKTVFRGLSTNGSDSDSTIPAKVEADNQSQEAFKSTIQDEGSEIDENNPPVPVSRLPRRTSQQASVAELVKRYQEYLPPSVSTELVTTALSPQMVSTLDSDAEATDASRVARPRLKHKHRAPSKKESISDFEHSYAANVAPKYLTHKRPTGLPSRIPGPYSTNNSHVPSRRTSPDKRPSNDRHDSDVTLRGRSSPPLRQNVTPTMNKGKTRVLSRNVPKERLYGPRTPSVSNAKGTVRKTSNASAGFGGGKVTNMTRHFERIHKDLEKANRRYTVIRGRRARPVASSRATVEVFDSVKEAIKDVSDVSDSSSEADDEGEGDDEGEQATVNEVITNPSNASEVKALDTRMEHGDQKAASDAKVGIDAETPLHEGKMTVEPERLDSKSESKIEPLPQAPRTPLVTPPASDLEAGLSTLERPSTLMKALTGFWPNQMRGHFDMEGDDLLADPEHIFRESSMVVRTDEPTSIIALALNSPQYREMLAKSRADKRNVKEPKLSENSEAFMPDDSSVADSLSTWGVVNIDATEDGSQADDLRVPSTKFPAITFESGGLTITCTILYPEQFDALRRKFDCEKSMIESLARCVKWNASGGKSGSAFLKTSDDRFIAKELSKAELETMAIFGPAYFEHMSTAIAADRPTLLAKVFGCYKLVFRKTEKEKSSRVKSTSMNLLVMENLFYDKRFTKIFDLKGSTRNRHVPSTGRENEVLLDENLVETAHISPFYVREHMKRILRSALLSDTKFLAEINVMDYSLVVGVDSTRNELVVGIVDYIRTYTWDKKLESWVKESAFLGAQKGEPTIVSPKQYRQRFLSAMERYFPLVPDRWMKDPYRPDDEGDSLLDLWPDW